MNTRRKFTVLALLFALMTALACKKTDFPDPENSASDKEARSAVSDTASVPQAPEPIKPGEGGNPPSDTTFVPEEPQQPVTVSLADEKFVVRAEAPDTLGKMGIVLTFTSEQYVGCGDSYLPIQPDWKADSPFEMQIGDLVLPNECTQKSEKAVSRVFLYPVLKKENILRIRIGGKSFEGKIIREDTRYIFEWPDESQFKFADKVLNL